MQLEIVFTERQLDLLREARARDAPDQSIETFIANAFVAEAEREQLAEVGDDELD